MFAKFRMTKGVSILEYSLLLGIIGLVFIGMNTYVKRALQGRIKDMTNQFIGSEQVGDVNPTAVSGSYVNPNTGMVVPATTDSNSVVTVSDVIGGARTVDTSRDWTHMESQTLTVDDGRYKR